MAGRRKLSAIYHVCRTCQGNVNMPPEGQKCQLKHGRETQTTYPVCQTCEGHVNMPPESQKYELKHGRETQCVGEWVMSDVVSISSVCVCDCVCVSVWCVVCE